MEDTVKNGNAVTSGLPPNPFMSRGNKSSGKAIAHETEQPTKNPVAAPGCQDAKFQRVLASRRYSQKYRLKQMQYMMQLEKEVKALQAQIEITAPRIKYVDLENSLLRSENGSMKQKLSAYTGELGFKEAQYLELKQEREKLMQLYVYQNQQKQQNNDQNLNFPFGSA